MRYFFVLIVSPTSPTHWGFQQSNGMYTCTPTNLTANGPQEFFGQCTIPERGTLVLVGLGLGGPALIRKRK
jgi:hypothetical protein